MTRGAHTRRSGHSGRKFKVARAAAPERSREETATVVKEYLDKLRRGATIETTELAIRAGVDPQMLSRLKDELWQYVTKTDQTARSFGGDRHVYVWHAPELNREQPDTDNPLRAEIVANVIAFLGQEPDRQHSTEETLTGAIGREPTPEDWTAIKAAGAAELRNYWCPGPAQPGRGMQKGNTIHPWVWSGTRRTEAERARSDVARLEAAVIEARQKLASLENPNSGGA